MPSSIRNDCKEIENKEIHEVIKYNKESSCITSPGQGIERHNYRIINSNMIKCLECGKTLINDTIELSHKKNSKKEMRNLDKSKNIDDITIYRISLRKTHNKTFLPFPGKSYIGQTISKISVTWSKTFGTSRWNKHLTSAFNNKHKDYKSKFSKAIRKYSDSNIDFARKLFAIDVLQLIKSQEDKISTQKLANKSESFWIGYYHTQFDEFGWNLLPGGQDYHGNPVERIVNNLEEFNEIIEQSIFIKWQEGPLKFIAKHYKCDEFTVYEACYFWFNKSYREIRYERIKWFLEDLMMQGFKSVDIRTFFKLPSKVWAPGRVFNSWCEEIYGKEVKFNDKRNELLKEKFSTLIRLGYISIKDLEPFFKGLGKKGIEYFLEKYMGGLKKSRFILFFKPRAVSLINNGINNVKEFLKKLGFNESDKGSFYYGKNIHHRMKIDTILCKIFGMNFDDAKKNYKDGFITR